MRKAALRLRIFKLIEAIAYENGCVNRTHLMKILDMGDPKASLWLTEYREICPDALVYDPKLFSWKKTSEFKLSYFDKPNTKEYIRSALIYLNKTVCSVFANDNIKLEGL